MKRGEIWTVAGGVGYAHKPRPAVIMQTDKFAELDSVTICLFSSNSANAGLFRIAVTPTARNGLEQPSWLMADKLMTVPRERLGRKVGRLEAESLDALGRALLLFLGIP